MQSKIQSVVAGVAAAVLAGCVTSLFAQSLADAARKEDERRKDIKAPAKVYTNRDLGQVSAAPTPPPAAAKTPSTSQASGNEPAKQGSDAQVGAKAKDKEVVKDQAYWVGRRRDLIAQLDRDQTYVEALQSRVNALTADFVNRDDPMQRATITRDR